MQKTIYDIAAILIIIASIVLILIGFIITITFMYKKRQSEFAKNLVKTKMDHENEILSTRVEIQEQTFQHISKEIHDNINLSLTLAKLNLYTLDLAAEQNAREKIESSIALLSQSISQLNDLSKSLDADIINRHSLLKALEEEIARIRKTGLLEIDYECSGTPIYMNSQSELVIFRVIQEAFNNIIRHARARMARLFLHYSADHLEITLSDDGVGFDTKLARPGQHAGLRNMGGRVRLLGGEMRLESNPGRGCSVNFTIPLQQS